MSFLSNCHFRLKTRRRTTQLGGKGFGHTRFKSLGARSLVPLEGLQLILYLLTDSSNQGVEGEDVVLLAKV